MAKIRTALWLGLVVALLGWLALAEGRFGQENGVLPGQQPIFSHSSGYYTRGFRLKAINLPPDATLLYTLNGQTPALGSAERYQRPILVADSPTVVTLQASFLMPDGTLGPVTRLNFIIGLDTTLPVLALTLAEDDFSGENGIVTNSAETGRDWERPVTATFYDPVADDGFNISGGLRIHGRGSRLLDKKGFRLYFRKSYGSARLDYPLFDDGHSLKRLVIHNGGLDLPQPNINWTLMRNALGAELATDFGLPAARHRPAILFINGRLWGIYQLRERIDKFYLADQLGVTDADLLDTPEEIAVDSVKLGDRVRWDALIDYLTDQPLTDDNALAVVATQVDLDNFLNYQLLNIYSGNADWPAHNQTQFRPATAAGRWQWIVWDMDRAFGFARLDDIAEENMVHQAQQASYFTGTSTGDETLLLRRLLERDDWRELFLARLAIMLNTVVSAEAVTEHIDQLAAPLTPDIDYEIAVWPSQKAWLANVEALRQFARLRPDVVRGHAIDSFGLSGTFTLHIAESTDGHIEIDGQIIPNGAWSGIFFQNIPISVSAHSADGSSSNPTIIRHNNGEPLTLVPLFKESAEPLFSTE